MPTPRIELDQRFRQAFATAFPQLEPPSSNLVVPTAQAEHGDYQCNQALPLAKALKSKPRDIAAALVAQLDAPDIVETAEIAGPGFINLRLRQSYVEVQVAARAVHPRLGIEPVDPPRSVIVDYSSPNVAKPMHVGHIRSTIIGDAIARTLRFIGHRVISDNHIGDWGTQFGMLILGYKDLADHARLKSEPVAELKRIYKEVNARSKADEAYRERARAELVKLQAEDPEQLRIWREVIDLSSHVADEIYQRLNIRFDVWHGESFYNPMLADVVKSFKEKGLAREDQGATVVFFDGPDDPTDLHERPLIIQKRDGAYLYSTSDLAAIKFRDETWHAEEMIYVVGGTQQLHFRQLFAAARKWGYRSIKFEHAWFGSIQGADGKPFKTREGEPPELADLLEEAERRALAIVTEKQPDLPEAQRREVARVVGLGAVKYADLAQARTSDYIFSWDKMLALQGNTAPYMQYAFARINSIAEKAAVDMDTLSGPVHLEHAAESALARMLLRFGDAIEESGATYRPSVLTSYLYDLASAFSSFVEHCRVKDAEEPLRTSRLTLCRLVSRTLQQGLDLLGIETLPRM